MNASRRGWSLLELVFVVAIMALLLMGGYAAFRRPTSRASSRAMAEQLGEAFRAARALAMAESSPVALVFPTQGSRAASQSVAFLRGEQNAAISRVLDFSGENPQGVFFIGTYPSLQPWTRNAPQTGHSRYWLVPGPAPGSEPLQQWLGNRSDFVFLFSPDGGIHTNDLPNMGGAYRIVVAQGVISQPTGIAGAGVPVSNPPPYHALSDACDPYTLTVTPLGAVKVTPGLEGASPMTLSRGPLPLTAVAAAPVHQYEPVTNPQLLEVNLSPPAGSEAIRRGVDATIAPKRQLTVTVRANITTSDDLFCEVVPSGTRGGLPLPHGGSVSSTGPKRMRYYPPYGALIPQGSWYSNWQWNPPEDAQNGDLFTFQVTVTTRRGGSANSTGVASLQKRIEIFDEGRIVFGALEPLASRYQIFAIKADGTDLSRLTNDEASTGQMFPAATRDGSKLLFSAIEFPAVADLVGMNRGGGLSTQITFPPIKALRSNFSDDTSVCVFDVDDGTMFDIHTFVPSIIWPPPTNKVWSDPPNASPNLGNAAPAISNLIGPPPAPILPPGWQPPINSHRCNATRRMVFESDCQDPGKKAIYTCLFNNPGVPKDSDDSMVLRQTRGTPATNNFFGGDRYACFHPRGDQCIAFQSDRMGGGRQGIYLIIPDLVNGHYGANDGAVWITPEFDNAIHPFFSPLGNKVCFVSDRGGEWDIWVVPVVIDPNKVNPPARASAPYKLNVRSQTVFGVGLNELNKPCWSF